VPRNDAATGLHWHHPCDTKPGAAAVSFAVQRHIIFNGIPHVGFSCCYSGREGRLIGFVGKWTTPILAALCKADPIVASPYFAKRFGRPLTRAEATAMLWAVHSLERPVLLWS
jgi:hypothetical protein